MKPVNTVTPLNMWGAFFDQDSSNTSVCYQYGYNPNCDTHSPGATAGTAALGANQWS